MIILFISKCKSADHADIRTHICVGCQPGDFAYDHFQTSSGLCVGIYGLTYSLYHPEGLSNFSKYCLTQLCHSLHIPLLDLILVHIEKNIKFYLLHTASQTTAATPTSRQFCLMETFRPLKYKSLWRLLKSSVRSAESSGSSINAFP